MAKENNNGIVENVLQLFERGAEAAGKFKTIADDFIDDWDLRPEKRVEAAIPGRPTAPAIYDYPSQWSKESLDQKVKDIRTSVSGLGNQIKGLFNLAYESPTGGQTATKMSPYPDSVGISPVILLAGVALLIFMGSK